MTIIKVPESVAVSPQDSTPLRYMVAARLFVDQAGNKWTVDEIAASRPGNKVRKWVVENYPEGKK